jgi:large subunit ribosomal protein L5
MSESTEPTGKPKQGKPTKTAKPAPAKSAESDAPAGPRVTPRLQTHYREQVAPKLMKEFGLSNVNQVPVIEKVIVNNGVGKVLENQKLKPEIKETVIDTYLKITGQKPVMKIAKKSVSNFKVREGAPSGFMVTLRRDRMWSFLDRLINLSIPRIKDFRGVNDRSFDKGGSWSFGLNEQAVWPEINMANVNHTHGMNITIVFRKSDPKMSRYALAEMGMPFVKPEDRKKGKN